MTKLEKIGADLKKARAKRDEWDQRVKSLEARYREEENTVIHSMVHAANLTPEMLAHIIAMASQGKVGVFPSQGDMGVHEDGNTGNSLERDEEEYGNGMY